MSEIKKIKVLYIDDEKSNLVAFRAGMREHFEVHIAESAKEGSAILNTLPIQIIVTDQRMPETTGIEFLESIMHSHPHCIRILLTGYSNIETVMDAVNKGKIFQYITKPYEDDKMIAVLNEAFTEYEKHQSVIRDKEKLEFILRQKLL